MVSTAVPKTTSPGESGPAPIAFFAFKRADHTRSALEALARNPEWTSSPLHIYCDGARNEAEREDVARTRAVVRALKHPLKTIVSSDGNLGLAASIMRGVGELVQRHGRVIVVEDDLVVSPGFLDYMNAALVRYKDEPRVLQVSGHMFPLDLTSFGDAVMLPFTTTWGWATWARAWQADLRNPMEATRCLADFSWRYRFDLDGAYPYARMLADQMRGRKDSWGIWWYFHVFQRHGLVVYPTHTLVRNDGFDGSGTHCGIDVRHAEVEFGLRTPTRLPPASDMPQVAALVRDYVLQSRGFARRVKDRWTRFFPSNPMAG